MNKKQFLEAVKAIKDSSSRKFTQTYDFVINLKGLNLKKPEEQVEAWVQLPHGKGKTVKIAALVGPELAENAKEICDTVITQDKFASYTNKKDIKKLAKEHDFFIAQANIMPEVAKTFGRVFGPLGKMPNPKAGCVVPPNANLAPLKERLVKMIRASAKIQPSVKVLVGKQDMADEHIAENMQAVYTAILGQLPQESNNIKSVLLKLTMGPPVKITDKGVEVPEKKESPKEEVKAPAKEVKKEETPAEEPAEEKKE